MYEVNHFCLLATNELLKFLFDIKVSIESIENYLGDKKDLNAYKANKMLRRAVEREFEIIGEALNCIIRLILKLKLRVKNKSLV